MKKTKLLEYREQMTALLADLEQQDHQGADARKTVELDQQSVGRLSRMDAMQHQAMARATQVRRDQMRTRISATFTRMTEGEFGYCATCGDDIALERLDFDPTVPNCINCAKG